MNLKLREKVLVIILVIWGLMLGLAYVGSQQILKNSYLQLEQKQANDNIQRVYQAIGQMIEAVNTMTVNWAIWDDTYKFVIDKNQAYIKSNLPPASFAAANVDIMLFYNAAGQPVFTEAVNADRSAEAPLPAKLDEYLSPKGKLIYQPNIDSNLNGFLSIPAGILLVAANAIVTSKGEGPVHGTLIMARYFNEEGLKKVSEITKLDVAMHRLEAISNNKELSNVLEGLLKNKKDHSLIKIMDSDTLKGYKLLSDINDKPFAMLDITMHRSLYNAGLETINIYNGASLISGIILTILLMYLLHIFIIRRLEKLNGELMKVSAKKDFSLKMTESGKDEVSSVSSEVNHMLGVIQLYDAEQKKLLQRVSDELAQVNKFSRKLKEAETVLRNVINSMPSSLIIVNSKLMATQLNPTALNSLGLTMEQAKGKPLFELFPYLAKYKNKFEESLQKRIPQSIDKIIVNDPKDNKAHYYSGGIYVFSQADENFLTIRLDDITEHTYLEQTLTQNEKLAALGVLTAGMAHEINNPVNFISATVSPLKNNLTDIIDLLKKYADISPDEASIKKLGELAKAMKDQDIDYTIKETFQLIDGIQEGASRTVDIVKDLRTFSRLDEDAMKKADINEGIQSTLNLLQHRCKDKVDVVTEYGDIPQVDCYPGKLNQVFMNIISNAIDAIPKSGKIFIKTNKSGENVIVSIRDTGTGIAQENLSKIFEPFFTTKEVGHGTGLGLSISFGIIRDHNGKIDVKSELGQGSEFIIAMPIEHRDVKE